MFKAYVIIGLMFNEGVDAGGESTDVKEACRRHHCRVRRDQVLERSQNVED